MMSVLSQWHTPLPQWHPPPPPQAARVSHAAQELKGAGVEIRARPLQYSKTPQIELDSFVGLTNAVKLRVSGRGCSLIPGAHKVLLLILMICSFHMTSPISSQQKSCVSYSVHSTPLSLVAMAMTVHAHSVLYIIMKLAVSIFS